MGQIFIDAAFEVNEGGSSTAVGFVDQAEMGPVGKFSIQFDEGTLLSVRMNRFSSVFIPGSTSIFEGPATAVFRENNHLTFVRGSCFVMIDDIHPEIPHGSDQLFLRFDAASGGQPIIRHAIATEGHIL